MSLVVLSRRRFVQGAAAAGAVLWASPRAVLRGATPTVFLPRPLQLTGADITLHAVEADVQLLPSGPPTRLWTFNGTFPGPTIRRPTGQQTRVTVVHQLPADAGSLTIHHHGGHQAAVHDGGPDPSVAIEPGASREYVYDLHEPGALQWYHDHSHRRTGRNTWMGLMGLFLVDDADEDDALGLPVGDDDIPLVVCDRRFDADNQLVLPSAAPPPSDEVVGDVHLVNGAVEPLLDVDARRYRFRILNASNFRVYDLALSNGAPLVQIGTESGLLPTPVMRPSVALGPGERADVVVDFAGWEGDTVRIVSAAAELVTFRVGGTVPGAAPPPEVLRPLPEWTAGLSSTPDRVWVFSLGIDTAGRTAWTVNGQAFDHHRVDARPELGSTESWLFVNAGPVAMPHYIHIHDVDWYVLSRNGAAPQPGEAGVKETFRLDPGEVLLVGSRFADHLGRFVVHCHMLEHEDHGMMATFEVVEPGAGDVPTAHRADTDPLGALMRQSMPPTTAETALAVISAASAGSPAPASVLDRPLPVIDEPLVCEVTP